ncbi:MAG: DUF2007 domain-containing protein [Caldilineales bacterium]|nr:DUF2007 domain-containing protein [Caldilineales bacterium]
MKEDTVVIKTYPTPFEAEVARAKLEAAGIGAAVLHDDAGGMLPSLSLGSNVRLLVHAKDADAALAILADEEEIDEDMEEMDWDDEDWEEDSSDEE